jgi:hypothetical protein
MVMPNVLRYEIPPIPTAQFVEPFLNAREIAETAASGGMRFFLAEPLFPETIHF